MGAPLSAAVSAHPGAARAASTPTVRPSAIVALLLATGVALRVWQYAADMSFWFDELSIARNIHERSLGVLLSQPLAYNQVAPVGFLVLEKISAALLGPSDLALRLFPLLCGIAALFLFWRLATRMLEPRAASIALALFAIGPAFIRYSGEVKQYGVDVLAALALTLIAFDLGSRPPSPSTRRCVLAGGAGLVLVWFSQTAVFVMVGLGAVLVVRWLARRDAATLRPAIITVPLWAVASLAAVIVSRHLVSPETLAFMQWFWTGRQGFFPVPFRPGGTVIWFWHQVVDLFGVLMAYPWPALYAGLALAGFVILWRQRRDAALLLLAPFAATLLATAARQYPFRARVVLFLVPTLVLSVAAMIEWLLMRAAEARPAIGAAVAAALLALPVYAIWRTPPPYFTEGYKPVLAYVQARHRAGDAVYVFSNAYEAIEHYGARYGMPAGSYVLGICDERDIRVFLQDVDRFRGAPRLWVIGSSVPDWHEARQAIGQYLRGIGVRRDSIGIPSRPPLDPVTAELFDLSDSVRLASATAATFPVGPMGKPWHPICHDWIRPTPGRPAP